MKKKNNSLKKKKLNRNKKNKRKEVLINDKVAFWFCIVLGVCALAIVLSYNYLSNDKSIKIKKSKGFTCEDGYNLYYGKCIKAIEKVSPSIKKYCNDGYELKNDKCVKFVYSNKFVENFYCPSGYTKESKGVCKREVKVGWHKTDYYCPNGYTLSGTKCVSSNVTGKEIYMCSNGAQLIGNVCQTFPISRCPYGYTVKAGNATYGYICVGPPETWYECPDRKIQRSSVCKTTQTIDASYVRQCDGTGVWDSTWTYCYKTEYKAASIKVTCGESGYSFDGKYCKKLVSEKALEEEYCEDNYVMEDNLCVKYDKKNPIEK